MNKKLDLRKKISEAADPFSKKEVRDKIIKLIIDHIEIEEKGSCRVGWACETILQMQQRSVPYNKISKIEALVTKTGKYKSRPHPNFHGDYEIFINPDYKKASLKERYWLPIAIFIYLLGLVTPSIQELVKQKILKQSPNKEQAIPDTSHKTNSALPHI